MDNDIFDQFIEQLYRYVRERLIPAERAVIEAVIARLGLTRRVRITGWIDAAQVREELLAARAMVLPSFAEGLPVVVMEAMALGRPVLTTYIAGIPELVQHGRTGWLFPAGDVDALVAAMKDCLASPPAVLDRMGAVARERVRERHDGLREAAKLAALMRAPLALSAVPGSEIATPPTPTEAIR